MRRPLLPGAAARAACCDALGAARRARPRRWDLRVSVGAPLARRRRALQLRRHALRRPRRRGRAEGVPARTTASSTSCAGSSRRPRRASTAIDAARRRRCRSAPTCWSRCPHIAGLRAPHRDLRGPLGAGAAEHARRARRRHGARQPVGVERHRRQVGVPPRSGAHVGGEEPRRAALQRRRLRRVDGRPRVGRPRPRSPTAASWSPRPSASRSRGASSSPTSICGAASTDRMRQTSFGAERRAGTPSRSRRVAVAAAGADAPRRRRRGTRCARRVDPHPVRAVRSGAARRTAAARSSSSRRPRWRGACARCRPTRAASSSASRAGATRRRRCWSRCTRWTCSGCRARDVVGVTMPGFGTSERTYAARVRARCAALGATLREIGIRDAAQAIFARHRPRRRGRGRHLRERPGVDAEVACCSRSRRRSAASTSAPATSPSWRSASPPTAATTCRTTASTPACRRRSSPS